MKGIITTLFVFVICTNNLFAQRAMKDLLDEKYGFAVEYNRDGRKWYSVGKTGHKGICDERGKLLIPLEYNDVSVRFDENYIKGIKNGGTTIFDSKGKVVMHTDFDDVKWYQMGDGFCEVKKNGKWGAMDRKGNLVVPCEFDEVKSYQLGDKDYDYISVKQNGKLGVIDRTGKLVLPCLFDDIFTYGLKKSGFCEVQIGGKKGAADIEGNVVIPCEYSSVATYQLENRSFCEVKKYDRVGLYDIKKKKEIVQSLYDRVVYNEEDTVYLVIRDGLYGISDNNAREIVPCQYSFLKTTSSKAYAIVSKGGVRPVDAAPLKLDYWCVPQNAQWGVVDMEGKTVVPFEYGFVLNVIDSIAVVENGGQMELKVRETNIYNGKKIAYYSHAYKNGKYGFYNIQTGKKTACIYQDYSIGEGYIACCNTKGKWGYLDAETMQEAIAFQYEKATAFKDGVAQVTKDKSTTFITHPKQGTSLRLANGGADIKVDQNIPMTNENAEESFAFIIANENYAHLKGADYSINDGKVFKEYCLKTFGMPEANVRYYEDATYGNMVNAVKKIKDIAEVYEGDAKIILYFSGLGTTDASSKERYLLPIDASIESLNVTGYSVQMLMEELNALNTKQTLVILDAPFSGLDKEGKMLGENRGVAIAPKPAAPKSNTILVTGSSGSESAYSSKAYGHSLFTYALLEKIQDSKGKCSVQEALQHAAAWVKKESLKQFDKTQSPAMQPSTSLSDKVNNLKF